MAAAALLCFLSFRRVPKTLAGGLPGPALNDEADTSLGSDASAILDGDDRDAENEETVSAGWLIGGALLFAGLLLAGILIAPGDETVAVYSSSKLPTTAVLPGWMRLGFLLPAGAAGLWLVLLLSALLRRGLLPTWRRDLLFGGMALGLVAIAWNCWVLDRFLIDLSPHWSQKHLFTTYYKSRKGPEEPIIAWQLYWRGENFYTQNQIYDHHQPPTEKTVFQMDHRNEKLQAYVNGHRRRRMFFILERGQLETVRGLLPAEARKSLQVIDESNNKLYLAVADL
jgi:hypothetical protein